MNSYKRTLTCDGNGCTGTASLEDGEKAVDWHTVQLDSNEGGLAKDLCPDCFAEVTASGPLEITAVEPEAREKT